jgi:hypothetical protein
MLDAEVKLSCAVSVAGDLFLRLPGGRCAHGSARGGGSLERCASVRTAPLTTLVTGDGSLRAPFH